MADLKGQNEKRVIKLMLVGLVPLYLSILTLHWEWWWEFADKHTWQAFLGLVAVGLGPLACLQVILQLIVNNVSSHWKERLAHFRWHHPLPGSRADKLVKGDSRIDIGSLSSEARALLDESLTPQQRNAHWYTRIYKPIRETPAVSNTHRRYLLFREASSGSFVTFWLIVISDLVSRLTYGFPLMTLPAYVVSAVYVLLLIGAAIQAGNRMVTGAISNAKNTQAQGDAP